MKRFLFFKMLCLSTLILNFIPNARAATPPLAPDSKPKVCGMLGASFDDSDQLGYKSPPNFMDYYFKINKEISIRITREPRLLPFLEALGMIGSNGVWRPPNERIRYVSTAWGGAQADLHYWGQLQALDRRIYLPELDCLIIGMSGSFFYRPQPSIDAIKMIHAWMQNHVPRRPLILIQYPSIHPGINVSWAFYALSFIDWSAYPSYRQNFDTQLCSLPNTICVDAWDGFRGGQDGWHPNWVSCQTAADRLDQAIRKTLGIWQITNIVE